MGWGGVPTKTQPTYQGIQPGVHLRTRSRGKGRRGGGGEGGKKETRLTGDGSTFSPP